MYAAYRVAHDGIDPLSGDWVEITQLPDDGPERGEVIREAIETMKHPENLAGERS
ncbi:hypothetical protein Tgr7_0423 [Thioalkalivibrio sulfidiphilus HL-EbGr7]|uniref:Uncharacterized protein n=1 Tax=Thioalkalivibrio sulfidiphilus (strain HL-EbGR7) TaxID=396588 RepID=B8GL03_THISH|nr:hypothetical protein Tgr7_0423 [Thioalkalivibrio sulfidiphilus HL-EbGr7]